MKNLVSKLESIGVVMFSIGVKSKKHEKQEEERKKELNVIIV